MSSHAYDYLDGSAAAGELSEIFAADITAAVGQCAHCGATKRFADAHLYVQCPGLVARCAVCEHVILRLVIVGKHALLDVHGIRHLRFDIRPDAAE